MVNLRINSKRHKQGSVMQTTALHGIVTGAASGIGLATCRMLLESGAPKVGMLDCHEARLQAAWDELAAAYTPDRVLRLAADVREPEAVKQAVEQFVAWAERLNLVVNCAGVLLDGAVLSLSFRGMKPYPLEQWDTTLDTNLKGVFLVAREAIGSMLRSKGATRLGDDSCRGLIVAISSISRLGRAGQAAYSASKGALVSLTATLAQELAPHRVRCVAIAPGLVDTPMAAQIPEPHRNDMLGRVAVQRMGRPEEIAHAIRFCIENEFFNGRVLEIDGGAF
jgi:3-oxoacyl-[acyl-carrier protein] reductase